MPIAIVLSFIIQLFYFVIFFDSAVTCPDSEHVYVYPFAVAPVGDRRTHACAVGMRQPETVKAYLDASGRWRFMHDVGDIEVEIVFV